MRYSIVLLASAAMAVAAPQNDILRRDVSSVQPVQQISDGQVQNPVPTTPPTITIGTTSATAPVEVSPSVPASPIAPSPSVPASPVVPSPSIPASPVVPSPSVPSVPAPVSPTTPAAATPVAPSAQPSFPAGNSTVAVTVGTSVGSSATSTLAGGETTSAAATTGPAQATTNAAAPGAVVGYGFLAALGLLAL